MYIDESTIASIKNEVSALTDCPLPHKAVHLSVDTYGCIDRVDTNEEAVKMPSGVPISLAAKMDLFLNFIKGLPVEELNIYFEVVNDVITARVDITIEVPTGQPVFEHTIGTMSDLHTFTQSIVDYYSEQISCHLKVMQSQMTSMSLICTTLLPG